MRTLLAKSAGFCFGVRRAVDMIESLLEQGERVCTLGPVIHNARFVKELESRGVRVIGEPEEAPEDSVIVVRSHGVPRSVYQQLDRLGLRYADATCPYVAKIHQIAGRESAAGATVLIAGDPDHPEVEGIRGHCEGRCMVFRNREELEELTREHAGLPEEKIIVVAQTTFNADIWRDCHEFLKKVYTNANIFDTICSATSTRQQEAKELASQADAMVIVGGKDSSNTRKLYTICGRFCPSYLVDGADELPLDQIKNAETIGVTAGASTPACIIKEVLNVMSGFDNIDNEDVEFAEALEKSFKMLSTDERVRGLVTSISPNEVQVDLGTKHAGYVPLSELTDDSSLKPEQIVKVGDEIELIVLRVNDQDGTVMLSKTRVDALKGWDEIVKANEESTVLNGTVTDIIKGGILASVNGVKVFIPASQTGVPKSGDMNVLLRQKIRLKIIEINEGRRRAVGSIRAVLRDEKKELEEKFWASVEIGNDFKGKVKSMTSYGAFIDLGGVDGMIHVSELSWSRIKHPNEVLNIGDEVRVYVKDLNKETRKVSLGYRDKGENPWETFLTSYKVGDVIDVRVVSIMPFGCFAQIIPGVDGLIHISQLSEKRVAKVQDAVELEQVVKVKIIEIDEEKKRISLSMREAANGEDAQSDGLGENAGSVEEQHGDVQPEADELGENS